VINKRNYTIEKINSLHISTKKITTHYSIYKTDSPCSYTMTKTCLVFFLIKQLGSSIPK